MTESKKTPVWVWVMLALFGLPVVMCTGGVVLFSAGAAAVASEQEKKEQEVTTAATQAEPGGNADVVEVELGALISEYENNEVKADNLYKGKIIRTKGIVNAVSKSIGDSVHVIVGQGGDFELRKLSCTPAKGSEDVIMNLSTGQEVTVVGRVSGLMMNVQLKSCVVQ